MSEYLSTSQIILAHQGIEEALTRFQMEDFHNPFNLSGKLLRASDVAEILNISKAFAYQLMQQGKIRMVVIKSARRVRPVDLWAFIEENLNP